MPIPWGTDLSTITPVELNAIADVTCTAGAWTTALNSNDGANPVPLQMVNRFDVYPYLSGVLTILLGATPPDTLIISFALVDGTGITVRFIEPGLLVTLAELVIPFALVGPADGAIYNAAPFNPLIQVFPDTEDVTATAVGSYAIFQLFPGNE